jgi:hypothetical protein
LGNTDFSTIIDHVNFKNRLMKLQPVKWKSKTLNGFIEEHDEWSKLISSYTNGVVTRRYGRSFVNLIEEPISVKGEVYYPKVLTNTDEYNNESTVQTNCVRTYINKPECFIVSLRKVTGERITVEYLTEVNKEEKITLRRIQTKEKFNKIPDSSWDGALDVLDNKIKSLVRGGHYSLPEKDVEYKLGLSKHSKGVIYNTGFFNTVSWDDEVEKYNMSFHDDDDLPL